MSLEELKGLSQGEVVVITKVDDNIKSFYDYVIGDEMTFLNFWSNGGTGEVNFLRIGDQPRISHFSYDICDYIERKVVLERNNKLNILGI